mmetsp:Transcript_13540/g.42539  ORF Transcript_13540/g.42539 Transcript_13540/m.42539 type:complete len:257 (+) Transcript_13540:1919-2689(+)
MIVIAASARVSKDAAKSRSGTARSTLSASRITACKLLKFRLVRPMSATATPAGGTSPVSSLMRSDNASTTLSLSGTARSPPPHHPRLQPMLSAASASALNSFSAWDLTTLPLADTGNERPARGSTTTMCLRCTCEYPGCVAFTAFTAGHSSSTAANTSRAAAFSASSAKSTGAARWLPSTHSLAKLLPTASCVSKPCSMMTGSVISPVLSSSRSSSRHLCCTPPRVLPKRTCAKRSPVAHPPSGCSLGFLPEGRLW